ncbi:MAG TPA: hypothetical protein PK573_16115 [Spirochaetota bacterium]|nr:hypothetical protein [Spirochaetota bacterium]HRZ29178.1 hypothetical protein [Spirochaetota bacterium]
MKATFKLTVILVLAASMAFFTCDDEGGENTCDAASSVFVSKATLPPGEQCPAGGVQIDMGFDNNANNVLDEDEITNTEYVCNGEDGADGVDGADGDTFVSDYVSVYHSATISYESGISNTLPFDSEEFDSNDIHDTTINNSRLTIQKNGIYLISAKVAIPNDSNHCLSYVSITLNKNGELISSTIFNVNDPSLQTIVLNLNKIAQLYQNDYLELQIFGYPNQFNVFGNATGTFFSLASLAP